MDNRELYERKLAELKLKQAQQAREKEKQRIIDNTGNFSDKYSFADEDETKRIEEFIAKLDIDALGHIRISHETEICGHSDMYLCFLMGTKELTGIYICGDYSDLMKDIDDWDFFSPYLLMIDKDFRRYVYIDDTGRAAGASVE